MWQYWKSVWIEAHKITWRWLFGSLKRRIVDAALYVGAVAFLYYSGKQSQLMDEITWIQAVLIAAVIIYVPMLIINFCRVPLLKDKRAGREIERLKKKTSESDALPSQQSDMPKRHYSNDDKDRISKAFRELRMVLTNEADPLQMNVQRLRQSWSQKASRNLHPKDFGEQIDIESTIDQIASIRAEAARLGNAVFDNFLKDNIGYEPLLKLVLGYRRPDPFRDLMHHADRLKLALEAANNAYQAAPERAHDFSQIVSSLFVHFEETNSKLNGWIAETTKRIDEQEKLLLSGG